MVKCKSWGVRRLSIQLFEKLHCDEIGPEIVTHVYDPLTGMRGVVVIDTLAYGSSGGGIRMLLGINTEEITRLARAMTYKFAALKLPLGGAKGGIWHNPKAPDRDEIVAAYGRAIKPLIAQGLYIAGADMGTNASDVMELYRIAGVPEGAPSGIGLKIKEGMPLEDHFTGFGVVIAAKTACKFADVQIESASVALEGFGKVGGGVARYIQRAGAKLVAISTTEGAIYNPKGLDVEKLLEMRKQHGDKVVLSYKDAKTIKQEELFTLPVDILVPGARPDVINESNAYKIKAKVVAEAANIPITSRAEEILFDRGIISVPDFIANAGGVISEVVDRMSEGKATEKQAFANIEKTIASTVKEVISTALRDRINPRATAIEMTKETVMEAIRRREKLGWEQTRKVVKEQFKI